MRFLLIAVSFLMLPLAACGAVDFAPIYHMEAFGARIVDEETGQPIEGANVVAVYETSRSGLGGPLTGTVLEVAETVTDAQGRFAFPAVTLFNKSISESIQGADPMVLIFKPRYAPRTFTGNRDHRYTINGQTVKLKRYSQASLNPEVKPYPGWKPSFYSGIKINLGSVIDACKWDKIPKAIMAMTAEDTRVRSLYPSAWISLPTISDLELTASRPQLCRSAAEFFRSYSK